MVTVRKFTGRVVSAGDAAALDPATQDRIDALWDAAAAAHPALFDGTVAGVARATADLLEVRWWRYRALVAQRAAPELFATLKLRPLGVTGLLTCADGIVLGQRQKTATQDAGLWELAPSGSVDDTALGDDGAVNLAEALLDELTEELGLPRDAVSQPVAFAITDDPESRIQDVFLAMETTLPGAAVVAAATAGGDGEYSSIAAVGASELAAFAAGNDLAGATRAVLGARGLLGTG